jgi:predicted O-methyltransferase YrrM
VEFGGYFGYSIAMNLQDIGILYSVEPDPIRAAVSTRLLAFCGLGHKAVVI